MADLREQRGGAMIFIALFLFAASTVGLTILAELAVKGAVRRTDSGARLEEVYRAIAGDPESGYFGYLGDLGEFPAGLLDLARAPTGAAPAICPSWQCWNGPYLKVSSIDSGVLLDPYNSPLEYFFAGGNPAAGTRERLAVISRGPDNNTSNAAANPNLAVQFSAPLPNTAGYPAAAGNADNIAHPNFYANVNSLDYINRGALAYTILNFDLNAALDALVPACPMMYTLQITSMARGASDTLMLPYSPGVLTDLWQGNYVVRVSSPMTTDSYVEEQVEITPGATNTRRLVGFPILSGLTPAFTLTVTNGRAAAITIYRFATNLGNVAAGATVNFPGEFACQNFRATPQGVPGTTLDAWVMPVMAYTRRVATVSSTLTVNNLGATHHQVRVLLNNLLAGSVLKRTGRSFASVPSGVTVTVTNQAGAAIQTVVMPAGAQTVTIP